MNINNKIDNFSNEIVNCEICNNEMINVFLFIYCPNCFHKQECLKLQKNPKLINNEVIIDILDTNNFDFKSPIKILDLNFKNTNILNNVKKYFHYKNLETISVGFTAYKKENYYNYKIISNENDLHIYEKFDIIIIENLENPYKTIKFCKSITHENSIIYVNNTYSKFTTNSMNYLCNRNNLILNNIYDNIYEIRYNKTYNSNTIDILYNEMINGYYDNELYLLLLITGSLSLHNTTKNLSSCTSSL